VSPAPFCPRPSLALPPIPPLDLGAMAAVRDRLDRLTKPPGSLGRLEELAALLAGMTASPRPVLVPRTVVVVAADHGVAQEGVSPYPSVVTAQMVATFLRGQAAINVLARRAGARVLVVDAGVAAAIGPQPGLLSRAIARGTANLARQPAMTPRQARRAIEIGLELAADQARAGTRLLVTGEMGIGNTTASSAITAAILGRPAAEVTGRGTGLDDAGLARKVAVVEAALHRHRPDPHDPLDVLAKVGGFEIGVLAGLVLGGAAHRLPVVLDGFITGAAALLAVGLQPAARDYLVAGHRSTEPGHRLILEHLALRPILELDLRLGEGTGATLAVPILDAAVAVVSEMATFAEAGVSERPEGAARSGSLVGNGWAEAGGSRHVTGGTGVAAGADGAQPAPAERGRSRGGRS
jgi:nicotinate-nucleotide--dimethylbenzimidazole phosphoribosyltransferase